MKLIRKRHKVPGVNTTSTADISFMFLIFFLVTTSMYVDKGIMRQLPPKDKKEKEQKEMVVAKENLMTLKLDAKGVLTVNDSILHFADLKPRMEDFITLRGKEHLIVIDADPNCNYENYFKLQNTIAEAYNDVREAAAKKDFGHELSRLTSFDRDSVMMRYPQRIAENYHTGEQQ